MAAFGVPTDITLGGLKYTFAQRNSMSFDSGALTVPAGSIINSTIGISNLQAIPMILPDSAIRIAQASCIISSFASGLPVLSLAALYAQWTVTNNLSNFVVFANDGSPTMINPGFHWAWRFRFPTLFVHDAVQLLGTAVTAWLMSFATTIVNPSAANVSADFAAALTYETWIRVRA